MADKNWHDKYYKKALIIPAILILFSIFYMINFYSTTGDIIHKDISLTGGTSITVYDKISLNDLKSAISKKLENTNFRVISNFETGEQKAIIIETTDDVEKAKKVLEDYLGYELVEGKNADIEFTGSVLSKSFYTQLLIAILIAFIFMGIVVFLIFKNFVPSIAVIISAFADILMTLVAVDILGMKVSTAGIVAFLMLIGYSVDTDILLTTRLIKRREGELNERLWGAFKTGITMTLTSLLAIAAALIVVSSFSVVLSQIFTVLVLGLTFDMINTWITNVGLLKWYVEVKK